MDRDNDFVASLGKAFVAHRLRRLAELFLEGYGEWLPEAGVTVPARSLSTLLLIDEHPEAGVTELAARLRLTHPFMIKAVARLEQESFVTITSDPNDARRRPVVLTARGREEVAAIRRAVTAIESAYAELFGEIGFDLREMIDRAEDACLREPFRRRVQRAAEIIEQEEETTCEPS